VEIIEEKRQRDVSQMAAGNVEKHSAKNNGYIA